MHKVAVDSLGDFMLIKNKKRSGIVMYVLFFVILLATIEILPSMAQQQLFLNKIATTGSGGYDVCISGDYAYVTNNDGFDIFDISNPFNPSKVGDLEIENGAFGISVIDNLAFVSAQGLGLVIANITDKTEPVIISQTTVGGLATRTFIDGDYAYVAAYENGLKIVNISDITSPILVGSYYDTGRTDYIWVNGNYAYLANANVGLEILDISDKVNPSRIRTMFLGGTTDLHRCGDLLFVSTYESSVFVLNISTASNPIQIGSYSDDDEGEAQGVVGNSTHIFVADNYGVEYLNISNLPQITEVAENRQGISSAHDIDFKDNFIFIAGGSVGVGLMVFEISDTEKSEFLGYYIGIPIGLTMIVSFIWLIVRMRKRRKREIS